MSGVQCAREGEMEGTYSQGKLEGLFLEGKRLGSLR